MQAQMTIAQTGASEASQAHSVQMGPIASAIVASSVANAVGTVIGHPLDTIRVSLLIQYCSLIRIGFDDESIYLQKVHFFQICTNLFYLYQ